jgi:hypothetical protein
MGSEVALIITMLTIIRRRPGWLRASRYDLVGDRGVEKYGIGETGCAIVGIPK